LPNLIILDVGHGNCAILQDGSDVLVFDASPGSLLKEYLLAKNQSEIVALLLSHSDADHIAGAIGLLATAQFRVHHVYLNPDASQNSQKFRNLRIALADARNRVKTTVHTELTSTTTGKVDLGSVRVEVVAPTPELAASGPSGKDLQDRALNSNSMSAVFRLVVKGKPLVLLAGDIDMAGLINLEESEIVANAALLVFPHHGGQPGRADAGEFTERLLNQVKPKSVVFSIGRDKHQTPDPEIVRVVLAHQAGIRVACTQLSQHCAADLPKDSPPHLTALPASGKKTNSCCAGSMEIDLSTDTILPTPESHLNFIQLTAPTALCRK
jgi:beta-lactamase superfamily II metal-dependent hydrolase